MHPREIHVVPRNLRWEVAVDGVTRPMIDWLCTKERALAHALELADELHAGGERVQIRVVVERRDGSVEEAIAA